MSELRGDEASRLQVSTKYAKEYQIVGLAFFYKKQILCTGKK